MDHTDNNPPYTSPAEGIPGTLYIVATPIGNLQDISQRALSILAHVELILCEDTRHFGRLAQAFGITTPKRSYHEHNEKALADSVVEELRSGKSVALVSDAGTPLISDPGYRLVAAARSAAIPVRSVPGACAAISALSISGYEIERFQFQGFLPQKPGKRKNFLKEILALDVASVFYESPHRIVKTMQELAALSPDRDVLVARELTKVHEEAIQGTAEQVSAELSKRAKILGEFVVVVRRGQQRAEYLSDPEE